METHRQTGMVKVIAASPFQTRLKSLYHTCVRVRKVQVSVICAVTLPHLGRAAS